jgi:hypothetical protein
MLSEQLLESDDDIDYQMYWERTIMYRIFKKKYPSEAWKEQLKRIKLRSKIYNVYGYGK